MLRILVGCSGWYGPRVQRQSMWQIGTSNHTVYVLSSQFCDTLVEMVPINLPGRDKASDMEPLQNWAELITLLADALCRDSCPRLMGGSHGEQAT